LQNYLQKSGVVWKSSRKLSSCLT